MVTIRKIIITLLLSIFIAELSAVLFLNVSYSHHLPKAPDEKTGRIYRVNANRFIVYGTKQEFQRLNIAEKYLPFAAICGLIAGILNFKYKDFHSPKWGKQ
ncbi:MAG TPA: hypothetical protein VN784_04440 [Candidatus Limnocylindrales bacterium]|nr:hypothetical protein [Candidatus Limnocylindrales bacterium]